MIMNLMFVLFIMTVCVANGMCGGGAMRVGVNGMTSVDGNMITLSVSKRYE